MPDPVFTTEQQAKLREASAETNRVDRLSAREVLFDHITGMAGTLCSEFCGGACECATKDAAEANKLIDAHAHALAEQIRALAEELYERPTFYFEEYKAMLDAALLIDQEVADEH